MPCAASVDARKSAITWPESSAKHLVLLSSSALQAFRTALTCSASTGSYFFPEKVSFPKSIFFRVYTSFQVLLSRRYSSCCTNAPMLAIGFSTPSSRSRRRKSSRCAPICTSSQSKRESISDFPQMVSAASVTPSSFTLSRQSSSHFWGSWWQRAALYTFRIMSGMARSSRPTPWESTNSRK